MRLDDLLAGAAIDDILASAYLREAVAHRGGAERLASTCDLDRLARLARDVEDRELILSADGRPIERPSGAADAVAWLAAGWSLAVRHAERLDAGLGLVAAGFASALLGPVDIQVHATPAGRQGFGWHYDPEEVFVVQCVGAKEWLVRRNTVDPDPVLERMPRDLGFARETSPILRVRLEAGDWLYVPGGWWHVASAVESDSVSLSIGVQAPTPLALLDALRPALLADPRWRRRLPSGGAGADGASTLAALGEQLARRLADPALPAAYAAAQRRIAARLVAPEAPARPRG